MLRSIDSILAHNITLTVVDNRGPYELDHYILKKMGEDKDIKYIDMGGNKGFGSRNIGLESTEQNIIGIIDDDICLRKDPAILEEFVVNHRRLFATGVKAVYAQRKWERERVDGWRTNDRAGSNFMVGRRWDFFTIGKFPNHVKSGCKWQDKLVHAGYSVAISPIQLAEDMGEWTGFDYTKAIVTDL
jgi:hypothetical protein